MSDARFNGDEMDTRSIDNSSSGHDVDMTSKQSFFDEEENNIDDLMDDEEFSELFFDQ